MELLMSTTNENGVTMRLYDGGGTFDDLALECFKGVVKGATPIVKHLRDLAWGSKAAADMLESMESRWPGLRSI